MCRVPSSGSSSTGDKSTRPLDAFPHLRRGNAPTALSPAPLHVHVASGPRVTPDISNAGQELGQRASGSHPFGQRASFCSKAALASLIRRSACDARAGRSW
jgi:hypothetical protein